ncbi:MAG: endonuclease/exonuclease/phosphatase family protein [Chloroflexi bacterium]|nr:endonuclease/exonuclease/phosphatase family protein [Chloroflexota bacterium]
MASRPITVGTYNVNNLFDRFDDPYSYSDDTWSPRATKAKDLDQLFQLGQRLREDEPDVLSLQEVEDKGVLYEFNVSQLGRHFKDLALIPGNDPRGIDVALASTLPLGQVVSYQFIRDKDTGRKLFSRDLLEVEVMHPDNPYQRLFTIFVNHFKSKFIDPKVKSADRPAATAENDRLRWKQASAVAQIVKARFPNPNDFFIIAGDFNDTPDAATLAPLLRDPQLRLFNVLDLVQDTSKRWTHYWKKENQYSQLDYLLLSPALAQYIVPGSVQVVQKGYIGGSDHRPVYVKLQLF